MPEFTWAVFPLLGIVAGVLAGLLGIGGGIVLVAALVALLPLFGVSPDAVMHVALATSLASIIVTASASANAHRKRGSVLWPTVAWLAPGLVLGGVAGSAWAIGVDGETLATLVGAFCLLMAARMAWPTRSTPATAPGDSVIAPVPRGPWLGVAGGVIGAVSAVVGIGGGSLTVPLLVSRGVATVRAVGTSSACGVVIALASAATYALVPSMGATTPSAAVAATKAFGMVGHVHVPGAVGIGLGAWFAAPYGVRLAHRLSGVALARVFAVALASVGVALLWP
ncbi:sulfite exporter TauE/SafE family protein [Silanimonas sp.]|uniref:sulfite exporter TauE/SafE family protein n=1 Tax=Silanimonas sp. TaxID=1929290 RepID=UPI0022C9ED3B|nr:sulfite exporter TauE/SafE family protein [Silanimonas sp.]MCZ8164926.1 sulfite exporter TauE/SafE family protein [Silanimonas sp.]